MKAAHEFFQDRASREQIAQHLSHCDRAFVPPLSERGSIGDYAEKIADKAERFEAWVEGELVGLLAAYCNDTVGRVAFISNVSVLPQWQARGIARQLVRRCLDHARGQGFQGMRLEVDSRNLAAFSLYVKHGFQTERSNGQSLIMYLAIGEGQG